MANLLFSRGTLTQITSAPVTDGQWLVATDKEQLFVDYQSKRLQINDVIFVATLPEATTANVNKIYYASTPNVLAISNGTAWTQINAQQVIAEGSTNGTISVGGVDVPVHGLGSAAYENTTAFDAAGSAAAVQGTPDDESSDTTVYGAIALANEKVASVTAGNNSITVAGTATAPTVAVKISQDEDNVITVAADGLKVSTGAAPAYTMTKLSTATEGYAASYALTKDGTQTGVTIDIPKDYLVQSAQLKTATEDDPSGFPAGTKYIDFVVNTSDSSGTEDHIYLNVADLVDAYTAGNGISVSESNEISANVVAANGLSVNASGIAMAVVSASANGAMLSTDKTKLDGIEAGAQVNTINAITLNGKSASISSGTANLTLAWNDLTV